MQTGHYPSKLLENAVNEFAGLPGIGKKTALRLVLHLLRQEERDVERFGEAIIKLKKEVHFCESCYNISDSKICSICSKLDRDHSIICVVENIRDVMAIESTDQYKGIYHVLGGVISPMDGIGPGELTIDALEEKVKKGQVKEVILALRTTMEGDTTNFYIYKKLHPYNILISIIARGVAVGDELEYTDEVTLGRSITKRTEFKGVF